ncbi:hypothetical protein NOVOSPHI9U_50057 [Novosphingobium sp. 9U]|nr:hypothetical protein NOVOSPHI9U_50057 [Novosphingobium sp. 9U]
MGKEPAPCGPESGTTHGSEEPRNSLSPSRLEIKRETLTNCLGRLTRPLALPVGAGV